VRDRPDKLRIDLWRWTLQVPETTITSLRNLLSPDEIARAERFIRPIHGGRYIAGRGRLRQIISSYLGRDPVALEILTDEYGKPFVASGPTGGLHFNLSHSQDQALLAVSRDLPLGVDIEMIRPIEERVERIFSPAEQQDLASLSGADWTIGFYNCWTRKEAFVKALGHGLSLPLDDFDVSLRPGEPARLIRLRADPDAPKRWKLIPLEVEPRFAGALAVASWDAPIELIDRTIDCWPDE
jgi:4'-phosphopantetheinyl transferase